MFVSVLGPTSDVLDVRFGSNRQFGHRVPKLAWTDILARVLRRVGTESSLSALAAHGSDIAEELQQVLVAAPRDAALLWNVLCCACASTVR